ncbi:hypothetical protein G7Y31_07465 [Corynebacterium lizhenjunii]|uniref:Secreted protein n=1 Tax=Corynebacterium lizhenjunii TaxID=2709394 RepID=A0A7T0KEE2_9CORY|nr:hypothetical protein [Corynebacterium lizhenjunii]QPK78409.1 hypothetical protein G7Y31_07465 [Corynebacterium lizhenjunii]
MRNFRTAAVAAATAVAVAFSGTAIASAADAGSSDAKTNQSSTENKQSSNDNQATGSAKTEGEQSSKPNAQSSTGNGGTTLSSKIGAETDAHKLDNKNDKGYVTGTDLSSNNPDNGKWVNIWSGGTYALVGTAIAGALIALYNYAVYTGLLPNHILDSIFR